MAKRVQVGILGSGRGSNCRAILAKIQSGELAADVPIVISDVPGAGILKIAEEFGVPTLVLPQGQWRTKLEPETEELLVRQLRAAGVELIALAGFMRIVKAPLLDAFPRRIINVHPSLLPKFPGREAWAQALQAGEQKTGCTVHFVDAGVDTGEIIAQREVLISPNDTPASLHARIQSAERELYPQVIAQFGREWAAATL